jgi:hypothetical protein
MSDDGRDATLAGMVEEKGSEIIKRWDEVAREPAQLVIEKYGEPHEATESLLIWHSVGPWKRVVASKIAFRHNWPRPHWDAVESVIDYRVPVQYFTPIAQFDGSVIVERTAGEVSARCHDEEANFLALNLMNDIVTGQKTVQEARDHYVKEVLDYRRKLPTPDMTTLRFKPQRNGGDPDERVISDEELAQAARDARSKH